LHSVYVLLIPINCLAFNKKKKKFTYLGTNSNTIHGRKNIAIDTASPTTKVAACTKTTAEPSDSPIKKVK